IADQIYGYACITDRHPAGLSLLADGVASRHKVAELVFAAVSGCWGCDNISVDVPVVNCAVIEAFICAGVILVALDAEQWRVPALHSTHVNAFQVYVYACISDGHPAGLKLLADLVVTGLKATELV